MVFCCFIEHGFSGFFGLKLGKGFFDLIIKFQAFGYLILQGVRNNDGYNWE